MPEKTYLEGRPEPTAYHPSPEEYFGLLPGYSSFTEQILALQGVSSFSGEGKKFLPYALAGLGILAVACGTGVVGSEAPGVHPTGMAIPEIGPTSAPGSMDLMFNQPAGTVSAIQPFCAADKSLCMYEAGGDDGGVVAMAPLFGPEFVNDGVNVTIRGFIPGGYQEITDPDRNGDPDGGRFSQSKIWPADLTTYFTVSEADQARFDEFLAKATTNGVPVSIDIQMDADERVTIILTSLGSDGPTVFTNTVQLEPLTVQDLLGYGGDEPVVAHEMASGGGVQFRPLAVDPTGESYNGAEVTVNGEAGTIEVGGQVINTPAETKPAPTATPELLPAELSASLPDGYQIVDNQVIVNGQAWYEMTPEKQWQATDWKILEDAPMKISWQPESGWRNDGNIIGCYSWPVATGEPAVEKQLVLDGQAMTVLVLPAIIRDMLDPKIIRDVFVPLIYKDKNGQVLLETYFITGTSENGVEKTIADLLQSVQRGQQLELKMAIGFNRERGVCRGYNRCEIQFDLIKAQGLNIPAGTLSDGDILPIDIIADFIKGGKYLLPK